jgi:phosphate transport system substrate-binding protein
MASHEGVRVLVSGMGSSSGIEAVGETHTADIGTSSRDPKGAEVDLPVKWIPVANDGIAVIVHPSNPLSALSRAEIRAIFAGEITNWRQLGGDDVPVTLINRDESSGTRDAFDVTIMDGTPFDINAVVLPGTGQVREVVTRSRGAIGYISVGFVAPRFVDTQVKALSIDGIEPSDANIDAETYPLARKLYFILPDTDRASGTNQEGNGADESDIAKRQLAGQFLDYVLSDVVQNGAVRDAGFLPVLSGQTNGQAEPEPGDGL